MRFELIDTAKKEFPVHSKFGRGTAATRPHQELPVRHRLRQSAIAYRLATGFL